ncbi:MAG: hypothetical protein EP343_27745 [Deltaproteobacteria bacterium]|nr:MAG: hypothetical protein EP343_27745 [Deltaproteobacteria bacterium]
MTNHVSSAPSFLPPHFQERLSHLHQRAQERAFRSLQQPQSLPYHLGIETGLTGMSLTRRGVLSAPHESFWYWREEPDEVLTAEPVRRTEVTLETKGTSVGDVVEAYATAVTSPMAAQLPIVGRSIKLSQTPLPRSIVPGGSASK